MEFEDFSGGLKTRTPEGLFDENDVYDASGLAVTAWMKFNTFKDELSSLTRKSENSGADK